MADRYASLKQGLVGAWIPSVSGSGLLLPDLSGRGNNGALTNMDASDWVSSQYGRALDFDGSNDYSTATLSAGISGSFTFSCWAFIRTLDASVRPFITSQVASYNNYWASLGTFQSRLSFGLFDGSNNPLTGDTGVGFIPNTNQWYHFVGVRDVRADTISDYVNGVFNRSVTDTTTSVPTYGALTIGGQTAPAGRYVNGLIDDVRVYDRALSPAEIRLLASEPGIGFKRSTSAFSTRYTYKPPKAKVFEGVRVRDHDYASLRQGLVGAWCPSLPNGGSGNTLPDQSGRGNHGTLTNMGPEDWVSSGDGRALDFDNTDDYVSCSSQAVQSLTSGTICFWLKTSKEVCAPFCIQQATSVNDSFQIGIGQNWTGFLTNELITVARVGSGSINRLFGYTTATRTELLDNQWHHVAIVASGSYAIYIDGVSKSLTFPGAYPTNDGAFTSGIASLSNLYIGGYRDGVDILPINGQMDDVRVYSRGLTESEIRLLASRRGIGLQPSPTRFIAREKKTGLRRKILTGQT